MIKLGLVEEFPSQEMLAGSYWIDRISWIVWIVLDGSYQLDHIGQIVLAGLYRYRSWVCSEKMDFIRCLVCYWLDGTDGLDGKLVGRGWDGGTDVSRRRIGAPTLALEGRQEVGSGGWHQLPRCRKGAEYLCWSRKIIQIYCTKIGTNMQYEIV